MKETIYVAKILISKEDWPTDETFKSWCFNDQDLDEVLFYKQSTDKTELGTELRKISMKLGGKVIREEMTKVSNVYSNIDD